MASSCDKIYINWKLIVIITLYSALDINNRVDTSRTSMSLALVKDVYKLSVLNFQPVNFQKPLTDTQLNSRLLLLPFFLIYTKDKFYQLFLK